jgi:hypothetical protein
MIIGAWIAARHERTRLSKIDTPGHARGPKCLTASVEADLNKEKPEGHPGKNDITISLSQPKITFIIQCLKPPKIHQKIQKNKAKHNIEKDNPNNGTQKESKPAFPATHSRPVFVLHDLVTPLERMPPAILARRGGTEVASRFSRHPPKVSRLIPVGL